MRNLFETKYSWDSSKKRNCCIYCNEEVKFKYIATGHDHTDYDYVVCSCSGARKTGKPWEQLT